MKWIGNLQNYKIDLKYLKYIHEFPNSLVDIAYDMSIVY